MTDIELVEEVFGEQLRRTIEHSSIMNWDIRSALTTDFTKFELSPPPDADAKSSTLNARIRESNNSVFILNYAKHNYNLFDSTEAYKRLLRVGPRILWKTWGEKVSKLNELEYAATITSNHLGQDNITQSRLKKDEKLSEPNGIFGTDGSTQQRIFWYQKLMASKLSEELGIPQSHILHISVLAAGVRLGDVDAIKEKRHETLKNTLRKFDEDLNCRIERHERIVFRAIAECVYADQGSQAKKQLQKRCPQIWSDFQNWAGESESGLRLWDDM